MLSQAFLTSCSIALAHSVYYPAERRYKAWKASRPEIIMYRDWRGRLVPDLRVKRMEQAAIGLLVGVIIFGIAVGLTVMLP